LSGTDQSRPKHICVCICTHKRPVLLGRLLSKLDDQQTEGLFDYSAVIVDNDKSESARPVAEAAARTSRFCIGYHVEPEQNIARARNRAVENAKGDLIAFIDDDEFPMNDWLLNLFKARERFGADGILGPVRPHFEDDCPAWIPQSRLCERPSHDTGTVMPASETRTGNLLLKKEIFDDPDNRFDPQFGRTGGEDVWFFMKISAKGRVFVWCEEAAVYETVPPERWKESFYFKRAVRIGGLSGDEVRTKGLPGPGLARVIAGSCYYSIALPFALCCGKPVFMRHLVKGAYNVSFLLGYFGHVSIRFRDD